MPYEAAAIECACRGMHDEARRLLDRARVNVAINGFDPMPPHLARVVALCALCRGDLTEVVDVLEDQVVRFNGVGSYLEPLGVAPLLVEAYLGLGRDDDARELTARFGAAQPDQPYPHVAAMVARCEGLVATDLDDAVMAFERSLALHGMPSRTGSRWPARGCSTACGCAAEAGGWTLGRSWRPHGVSSSRWTSRFWAERAAQELAGTGERVQSRDATREPLTSQETRVALLVAAGPEEP